MRLCSGAGCGRKIPEGTRFCDQCRTERKAVDGIREHTASDRDTYAHLYSGPRWQKRIQPLALGRHPMCARCKLRLTELIDHIVPAGIAIEQARMSGKWPFDKWAGFFLMSNLQGLCRPCHHAKTLEDKLHSGEWPDVVAIEAAAPKKVWSF